MSKKSDKKNYIKSLSSISVSKYSNTLKFYTLNTLLGKNRFYSFFLVFWHAKVPPSFKMSRY